MEVVLRPLTHDDVEAHVAGEDELTVRWLTGGYGDVPGTHAWLEEMTARQAAGARKRLFGVWVDGRLGGYVDHDQDLDDGLEPDDVNISYAVHPWARGRGVAAEAVRLVCDEIRTHTDATRAALRIDPANVRSVRVAERAGFTHVRDFESATDTGGNGQPTVFGLWLLPLRPH